MIDRKYGKNFVTLNVIKFSRSTYQKEVNIQTLLDIMLL